MSKTKKLLSKYEKFIFIAGLSLCGIIILIVGFYVLLALSFLVFFGTQHPQG